MDDLYFFRSDNGRIKIGRSSNVRARLNAVRCSSPVGIMLWATLEGRGYEELAWHSAFAGHRLSGEWFKWCLPIRRAIRLAQNGKDWWKRSVAEPDTDEDRLFRDMIRYSKEIEERTAA